MAQRLIWILWPGFVMAIPAVGITLHHQVGGRVERRQPLATLHVNDRGREAIARALVAGAFQIGATRPGRKPLILETIAR